LDEDTLTMVAADGFRLSICRANLSHSDAQPIRAIIPARALNELARIGADETQPISLHIRPARSQALFRLQGGTGAKKGRIFSAELVTQLIEGDYVDYYRLIPKSHTTRTIVDREWLLQACKTARIFVRNETNDIYLNLEPGDGSEPGRVRLTATSTAIGDSADETSAAVEGEPVEIGFDVRFLIDVLRVIDDAQIVLETTGPTRFAVIHPLGSDNFVHILAPMITPRLR
jgi:DNA polymerase-3 subunit beta